jgi:hypothetical protein
LGDALSCFMYRALQKKHPWRAMASRFVYGIEINDEFMAQTARNLFRAQMVLCVVSPLAGAVAIVRYVIIQTTFSDESSGFTQKHDFEPIRFGLVLLVKSILDLFIPPVLTLMVRKAVRHNSQALMVSVCICEGIGALLCLASMLNLLYLIPWVFAQHALIQDEKCSGDSSIGVEACLEDRDTLSNILIAMGIALVFQLLLETIQMLSFGTGSVYSKRARTSLRAGLRFVGLSVANDFERSQSNEALKDKAFHPSNSFEVQSPSEMPSAEHLDHLSGIRFDTDMSGKEAGQCGSLRQYEQRLSGIQEEI